MQALNAALGVGERAVLLREARHGQDHVGQLRRLRQEEVLHDEEVQVLEGLLDVRDVRVADHRVLAHQHKRPDRALGRGVHHLHDGQARLRRERRSPGSLELLVDGLVVDLLIAGVDVRQGAEIARALDVVLPAERIDAAAGDADVAR